MKRVSREELLKIAQMGRINIHEDEIPEMLKQLEEVLSYAQQVCEVARETGVVMNKTINVFREDSVCPSTPEKLLKEAPEVESNYFVVPKILETE